METLYNQNYYSVEGEHLFFDLFRPSSTSITPLVVFFHGGGWISGDKSMYHDEALWLADKGFTCACVEYRLAPQHPYPAAVADAQRFIQYARLHANQLRVDPYQIIAFGNSAGGHIASLLGLCDPYLGSDSNPDLDKISPKANLVIDICGVSDLTKPDTKHFPLSWAFFEQFMPCTYEENKALWEEASPLFQVNPQGARFLIIHGDQDDLVPVQLSQKFYEALQETGVEAEFYTLAGEGHSFTRKSWNKIRELYLRFLDCHLKSPAPQKI
jgi:acetyl esterase/lipase